MEEMDVLIGVEAYYGAASKCTSRDLRGKGMDKRDHIRGHSSLTNDW